MTEYVYTCTSCEETYVSDWTDGDLDDTDWLIVPEDAKRIVCDDCYRRALEVLEWTLE